MNKNPINIVMLQTYRNNSSSSQRNSVAAVRCCFVVFYDYESSQFGDIILF